MRFRDRADAGRRLAALLGGRGLGDPVVLGMARGGLPVARPVATALGAPLDVFVACKVGAPGRPELGIAAVAEGSDEVVAAGTVRELGVDRATLDVLARRERAEVDRRVLRYRGSRPLIALAGRDVVLVDDGLATGVTAEAALRAVRGHGPRRLLLAVPVGASDTIDRLSSVADEVITVLRPVELWAVGYWYRDFDQTTDDEVLELLSEGLPHSGTTGDAPPPRPADS